MEKCMLCDNTYSSCVSYCDAIVANISYGNGSIDIGFTSIIWGTKCKKVKQYVTQVNIPILCTCVGEPIVAIRDVYAKIHEITERYVAYIITVKAWCASCGEQLVSKKMVMIPFDKFTDRK